jgi:NAD(P)-dependent dehydrogenase (short-subunit alcohol dehydrogenase family)
VSRLEGRVAVITGGASGIGAATVRLFAENGAKVLIADLQEERAHEIVSELGSEVAAFSRTDVTQERDVAGTLDLAVERFGRLDIVFNNAGFGGALGPIDETSEDEYDITFDVLLKGVFFGVKHAARIMKPNRSGNILNTASVAALIGGYSPHLYSVAKAAVIRLTESTALELAEWQIRVNAICPGFITTPLTAGLNVTADELEAFGKQAGGLQPLGRSGAPEDIARAALFLACEESGFVTGHALVVDGGISVGKKWSDQQRFMTQTRPISVYRPPNR